MKRIVVKVGSNVITRPDGTLDVTRMSALVDQIAWLRSEGWQVVLISSGAVAAGRNEVTPSRKLDTVSQRQLYSAVGQAKLINRYYQLFRDHGLTCGQILTTKEGFGSRIHYLNQKHCMEVMIGQGVIPVINENDTVSVTELMFTDNDELSGLIASMMGMQALIILSNIDGVYDGDPFSPGTRLITDIHDAADASGCIAKSKSSAGRGGMATKYRIACKVASEGIAVIIANGKRDDILLDLMDKKSAVPHTLFHAAATPTSSVKKWIAHSEGFAKGSITVNEGAAEAMLAPTRASLLPVGVTAIDGDFEKDDIVRVVDADGKVIAWGRTSYKSDDARKLMGGRGGRPLIHSDYLYIDD